jgi:hypothetical protein
MVAASRSTPEWMASDIIETDPIAVLATSLKSTRLAFEITESRATLDLSLFFFWVHSAALLVSRISYPGYD